MISSGSKPRFRRWLALLFIPLAISSAVPSLPGLACAPTFTYNVIFNDVRPNLPLSRFAAGELGVVQASYAKSYLTVAYRYLTNKALSAVEQKSILRLWRKRLIEQSSYDPYKVYDCCQAYLNTRKKILGAKNSPVVLGSSDEVNEYSFADKIAPGALHKARDRQIDLLKKFGVKSKALLDWQKAQDIVFSSAYDGKKRELAALTGDASTVLKQYRLYQLGAVAFYGGDFVQAEKSFAKLASDKAAPDRVLASYMVARCRTNAVLAGSEGSDRDDTICYLETMLKAHKDPDFRQNLNELLMPLKYQYMGAAEVQRCAAANVLLPGNERFGSDVGDLTYSLDEMAGADGSSASVESEITAGRAAVNSTGAALDKGKSVEAGELGSTAADDLIAWLRCMEVVSANSRWDEADKVKQMRETGRQKAEAALAQYRRKHSLPWLVAALSLNNLRDPANKDLLAAAEKLSSSSPGYFTASYYVIDALAAGTRTEQEQALSRLRLVLNRADLPAGSRNLFQAQMLGMVKSADEYLVNAFMQAEKRSGYGFVPDNWPANEPPFHGRSFGQCAADEVADDLNIHLPLSLWLKACRQSYLEPSYRARLTRSVWLRAHLLCRPEVYRALTGDMCRYYPSIAALLSRCDSPSVSRVEAKYALAIICLRNFGMSPYVEGEEARHDLAVNQFDYYNENFWSPVSLKSRPKPRSEGDCSYCEFSDDLVYGVPPSRELADYNSATLPGINEKNCRAGISRVLSAVERAQAAKEAKALSELPPAKVLGDAVFDELKCRPEDENLPEMLYRVVKLAKWSPRTRVASAYSRKAHGLLHSRFAANKWTRQAPYWY